MIVYFSRQIVKFYLSRHLKKIIFASICNIFIFHLCPGWGGIQKVRPDGQRQAQLSGILWYDEQEDGAGRLPPTPGHSWQPNQTRRTSRWWGSNKTEAIVNKMFCLFRVICRRTISKNKNVIPIFSAKKTLYSVEVTVDCGGIFKGIDSRNFDGL